MFNLTLREVVRLRETSKKSGAEILDISTSTSRSRARSDLSELFVGNSGMTPNKKSLLKLTALPITNIILRRHLLLRGQL